MDRDYVTMSPPPPGSFRRRPTHDQFAFPGSVEICGMRDVVAFINLPICLSQDLRDRRSGDAQVAGGLRQREAKRRHELAGQRSSHRGERPAPTAALEFLHGHPLPPAPPRKHRLRVLRRGPPPLPRMRGSPATGSLWRRRARASPQPPADRTRPPPTSSGRRP